MAYVRGSWEARFWWCAPDKCKRRRRRRHWTERRAADLARGLYLPVLWYRSPRFFFQARRSDMRLIDRISDRWV